MTITQWTRHTRVKMVQQQVDPTPECMTAICVGDEAANTKVQLFCAILILNCDPSEKEFLHVRSVFLITNVFNFFFCLGVQSNRRVLRDVTGW